VPDPPRHRNGDGEPTVTQPTYQIGQVTERVGLSMRTVRYYEEVGLVVPSDRTAGGFRLYTDADIERLTMARELKPLGFTLEEVREILDLIDAREAGHALDDAGAAKLAAYTAEATIRYERLRDRLAGADRIARRMRRLTTSDQPA
jgi:DNA-binding transcriptional MerR regulator